MAFLPECFNFIGRSPTETVAQAQPLTGATMQRYQRLARCCCLSRLIQLERSSAASPLSFWRIGFVSAQVRALKRPSAVVLHSARMLRGKPVSMLRGRLCTHARSFRLAECGQPARREQHMWLSLGGFQETGPDANHVCGPSTCTSRRSATSQSRSHWSQALCRDAPQLLHARH
jgi:hypothetical protein